MNGVFGFLTTQTGTHIDRTTKTLTETAFNAVVTKIWESGGRNLSVFGHISQTAKFTRWDKNRIRMRVNDTLGGGHITSYLTEAGIEVDLIPMGNVPDNLLFILDTSRIKLRAKAGRKALLEKLGKMGDSDDWQLLSEFSMEMLPRVSRMPGLDYLNYFKAHAYDAFFVERGSGKLVAIRSPEAFLDSYGPPTRIEDLVFVPR